MYRRFVPAVLTALAVLVSLAAPVLAKEDAEARMDAPISRDAEPGSTIEVGWSVWTMDGTERRPIVGSPFVLTIASPDGAASTEVQGTESPAGSGHYLATITIPAGGVGEVTLGLRGRSCDNAGACRRSDLPIAFVESPLGEAAAPAVGTGSGGTVGDATPAIAILVLGVLGLLAVGTTLVIRRPRHVSSGPAGG